MRLPLAGGMFPGRYVHRTVFPSHLYGARSRRPTGLRELVPWSGSDVPASAPGKLDTGQPSWASKTEPACAEAGGWARAPVCLPPEPTGVLPVTVATGLYAIACPPCSVTPSLERLGASLDQGREAGGGSEHPVPVPAMPPSALHWCAFHQTRWWLEVTGRAGWSPSPPRVTMVPHAWRHILYSHRVQLAWFLSALVSMVPVEVPRLFPRGLGVPVVRRADATAPPDI